MGTIPSKRVVSFPDLGTRLASEARTAATQRLPAALVIDSPWCCHWNFGPEKNGPRTEIFSEKLDRFSCPPDQDFRRTKFLGLCNEREILGTLWKCVRCTDYYLCTQCYMIGKHTLDHEFERIDTRDYTNRYKC